jgi:uncharacterized protein YycO
MNYKYHIIHNFPKDYPFLKKCLANVIFFCGGTVIHHRKNLLKNRDLLLATYKLKKGDIVLVGGLRRLSSMFIGKTITHSLLYIGRRRFVHSVADGVEFTNTHEVFCEYDTMAILRPKHIAKSTIEKAVFHAEAQVGKPYDFDFRMDDKKFYCTELIDRAFLMAGFDCGVSKKAAKRKKKLILPVDFLNEKFEVIMLSHNLEVRDGNLELKSLK